MQATLMDIALQDTRRAPVCVDMDSFILASAAPMAMKVSSSSMRCCGSVAFASGVVNLKRPTSNKSTSSQKAPNLHQLHNAQRDL